jgi:hypothetical protein
MATDLPDWSIRAYISSGVTILGTVGVVVNNQPTVALKSTTTIAINNPNIRVQGVATGTAIGIVGTVNVASGVVNIGTVTGPVQVTNINNGVLSVGAALDFLGTFKLGTAAIGMSKSFTATKQYSAIYVKAFSATTAGGKPVVAVQVSNGSKAGLPSFGAGTGPTGHTAFFRQAICGCANEPGDTINVTAWLNVATTAATKVTVDVYGLTEANVLMGADGRAYPLAAYSAGQLFATGGAHTIIPAPQSTLRILVAALQLVGVPSAGSGWAAVQGTRNGASQDIGFAFGIFTKSVGGGPIDIPEGGLLLDPGTSLRVTVNNAGSWLCAVSYTLVL